MQGEAARPVSDFRSDTVTRPDDAMRAAMASAQVGDDVFGDDPTVHSLEERSAEVLGKEAALFLPTGTMANQVAVRCHCVPGDEVILHEGSHVYRFEQGGLAALHGVQAVPLRGERGMISCDEVLGSMRPDDPHCPRSKLVVLENTHNFSGGCVLPVALVEELSQEVRSRGLKLHLDGARLMNAAIALGCPPKTLAAPFDSVTLCLSKGLGAPIGTMLAGSSHFIHQARRVRKLLGGGLRQAGIIAAAGILALESGPRRLAADHDRARRLAQGLAEIRGLSVRNPETNIVIASLTAGDTAPWLQFLKRHDVLAVGFGPGRVRFVTHRDVDDVDVARAQKATRDYFDFVGGQIPGA